MEDPSDDIEFSWSEFEQADLLDVGTLEAEGLHERNIGSTPLAVDPSEPAQAPADVGLPAGLSEDPAKGTLARRQALNREHQRRYRLRQKARAEAVSARLANTTAELESLKAKQAHLEALLQSVPVSKSQSSASGSTAAQEGSAAAKPARGKDVDGSSLLNINLTSRQTQMTTQEVVSMTVPEFGILWAEYVKEIGSCLIQLHTHSDSAVKSRMCRLVHEAIRLAGRRLRYKPAEHRISATETLTPCCGPVDDKTQIYLDLLGKLDLSNDQFDDLMLLRWLFVTNRHTYDQRRSQLMASVLEQTSHPIDNLARVSDLSSQILALAKEDHELLCLMSRALYCGVLSMQQVAQVFVQSFPHVPALEDMLNLFAAERGLPSKADLIDCTAPLPSEKDWALFSEYCNGVNPNQTARYSYVPFFKQPRQN